LEATAISLTSVAAFDMPSTILLRASAVSRAIFVPFSVRLIVPSISSVVSFAAFADLAARFLLLPPQPQILFRVVRPLPPQLRHSTQEYWSGTQFRLLL